MGSTHLVLCINWCFLYFLIIYLFSLLVNELPWRDSSRYSPLNISQVSLVIYIIYVIQFNYTNRYSSAFISIHLRLTLLFICTQPKALVFSSIHLSWNLYNYIRLYSYALISMNVYSCAFIHLFCSSVPNYIHLYSFVLTHILMYSCLFICVHLRSCVLIPIQIMFREY